MAVAVRLMADCHGVVEAAVDCCEIACCPLPRAAADGGNLHRWPLLDVGLLGRCGLEEMSSDLGGPPVIGFGFGVKPAVRDWLVRFDCCS
ncbi:hypothetical protein ACLOJK_019264 [Asimina triloba]